MSNVAFPPLPGELADQVGGRLYLRTRPTAMRLASLDLAVDCGAPDDSLAWLELGTRILAATVRDANDAPPGDELIWQLPFATRLLGLLALTRELAPRSRTWASRCPRPTCRAEIEVDLPLDSLERSATAAGAPNRSEVNLGDRRLVLRPATGRDLRRWSSQGPGERKILADLLDPTAEEEDITTLTDEDIRSLDTVLSGLDPLVDLQLSVRCPQCDESAELEVDLERALIRILRAEQARLFRDVDLLARTYHWSEEEILRLPEWRRRRYLEQVKGAA